MARITERQLEVLRVAKDGDPYTDTRGGRNGGLTRTINSLQREGWLDWQNRLTVEGGRILQENGQ